jgi:hypothetical protein
VYRKIVILFVKLAILLVKWDSVIEVPWHATVKSYKIGDATNDEYLTIIIAKGVR